jgi:hypothetical protein
VSGAPGFQHFMAFGFGKSLQRPGVAAFLQKQNHLIKQGQASNPRYTSLHGN